MVGRGHGAASGGARRECGGRPLASADVCSRPLGKERRWQDRAGRSCRCKQIGQHAEAFLAKREAVLTPRKQAASAAEATPAVPDISDFVPNTVQPATTFPWEMASNVAPDQPAPPKEYAAENASLPERARFRGVCKVDTPLAGE